MRFTTLSTILLMATTAFAEDERTLAPAPEFARDLIYRLDYRGDGCRLGSVDWRTDVSGRLLSIRYHDLAVDAGQGSSSRSTYDSSSCSLYAELDVPAGWRVAIAGVRMRGYAYFSDANALGGIHVQSRMNRARSPLDLTRRQQRGPYGQDFDFTDWADRRALQWSDCNRAFNTLEVYTGFEARTATASRGVITFDRYERAVAQDFELIWERCDTTPPPPPPPPPETWVGSCRVVLETIWGDDQRDFYGTSRARDRQSAINLARQDGLHQCERVRGSNNLLRCTVHESQCTASRGR